MVEEEEAEAVETLQAVDVAAVDQSSSTSIVGHTDCALTPPPNVVTEHKDTKKMQPLPTVWVAPTETCDGVGRKT